MGTDCLQSHERDSSEQEELQSEELQPEEPQPKELQPEVPHPDAAPGHAPAFALHIIWVIVPMGQ